MERPSIDQQVTFLLTEDLAATAHFYEEVLQLPLVLDQGSCRIYRVSGDAVLAEDVAQEAFVRVWNKLPTFRPEGNFKGWICRIAANLTIDALRKRKPTVDITQTNLPSLTDGPEASFLKEERAAAVREAITSLPLHSRTALVLREYEGLSYKEIADVLDIPLGTVKSRLSDARLRLQSKLTRYLEE